MALNFPSNPYNGQLYPDPAVEGSQQYIWNTEKGTWLTVFKGVEKITGEVPIIIDGDPQAPVVTIQQVTETQDGYMTAADKVKLDSLSFEDVPGTVTSVTAGEGLGAPFSGVSITSAGTINLLPATVSQIGGVKPGNGLNLAADGTVSVAIASESSLGAVKQGRGINITPDGAVTLATGSTYNILDNMSGLFNGTQTTFHLSVRSTYFAPFNINSLLIFLDGILQIPNVSYELSGYNITFITPPQPGTTFYGVSLT